MPPNIHTESSTTRAGNAFQEICSQAAKGTLLLGIAIVFFALMTLSAAGAAAEDLDRQLNEPNRPWHIVADELSYDDTAKVYNARGNVQITQGDKKISADQVRFDHENMTVEASGHIVVSSGEDVISADSLTFDLEREEGQVSNGRLYFEKNHFIVRSDNLQKTGKDTYRADRASVTTCDGEKPDWKITGRNLNVTIEGYGTAYHAALWVKNVPILYTPWIGFPVKTKRQTGLLTPQIGYSSRKGYEYDQPLFWAINKSSDATFYSHYMSDRGNKFGTEYRYASSPLSKGTAMFDYLDDRRVDSVTGDDPGSPERDWGYVENTGDDFLRTNRDRYWFRTKNDQELPGNFKALFDLDIVSDQDYLTDFKRGYTGFITTRDYYNSEFGRDLDDYNDPVRLNRFNVNRYWSRFNLNAEARWYDDVIARTQDLPDTTAQRLPFIQFNGSKQAVANTPLFFDLSSSYTHFYRDTTTTDNGVTRDHRIDLYPRGYLPLDVGRYFTLEPSVGLRETAWYIADDVDPTSDDAGEDYQHREFWDIGLDLSTEIYRIFNGGEGQQPLKHTLNPRITYNYVPDYAQSSHPDFDAIDRIEASNQVTYSLSNLFIQRRAVQQKPELSDEAPGYRYHQMARFDIGQTYDFNEAFEDDPDKWKNGESREPFRPVFARLQITPGRHFRLSADADWSVYDNEPVSHSLLSRISDNRDDVLTIEHRYTRETDEDAGDGVNSLVVDGLLRLTRPLSLIARYEYDFYADEDLETTLGILYDAQCWSLDLRYTRDVDEIMYAFEIRLKGIGGFESGIAP